VPEKGGGGEDVRMGEIAPWLLGDEIDAPVDQSVEDHGFSKSYHRIDNWTTADLISNLTVTSMTLLRDQSSNEGQKIPKDKFDIHITDRAECGVGHWGGVSSCFLHN